MEYVPVGHSAPGVISSSMRLTPLPSNGPSHTRSPSGETARNVYWASSSLKDAENADANVTADQSVTSSFPEVKITITNSTLTAGVDYNPVNGQYTPVASAQGTALFINVPSDVLVEDSTLTASYQAVVVRGGTLP